MDHGWPRTGRWRAHFIRSYACAAAWPCPSVPTSSKPEQSCTNCGTRGMPCKHRKMARMRQRLDHALHAKSVQSCSSAPSRSNRATFPSIRAAPLLLRLAPPSHPIGVTCVAIVWRRSCADWSASLTRAALTMVRAAPTLLLRTPPCLPIAITLSAVVRVGEGRREGGRCGAHAWVMLTTPRPLDMVPWLDSAIVLNGPWGGGGERSGDNR